MIEPRLPQRSRLGRPPKTEMRRVVNALLYMVRTGCQWRQLPREFPPYTTVQHYFYAWRDSGVLQRINFELLLHAREAAQREPSPSAGVIDGFDIEATDRVEDTQPPLTSLRVSAQAGSGDRRGRSHDTPHRGERAKLLDGLRSLPS